MLRYLLDYRIAFGSIGGSGVGIGDIYSRTAR